MNIVKMSLLLGLSICATDPSVAAQSTDVHFNNSTPLRPVKPTKSFSTRLEDLINDTSSSSNLDILALLTAQQLSTGERHAFGKDKRPTEDQFRLMVSGVRKVMAEFKGNFRWDTFILDKLDQATPAFQGHLLHLYTMGRYFQDKIERPRAADTILKIKDECAGRANFDRVVPFLNKVQQVADKLGALQSFSENQKVTLIDNPYTKEYSGIFDANGAIVKVDQALGVNFSPEGNIIGINPVRQAVEIPFYVVPKKDADLNAFRMYHYQNQGKLTDKYLITDKNNKQYLVGHIDPSAGGVDDDDRRAVAGHPNVVLLSSGQINQDVLNKIAQLSDFLVTTSGMPYNLDALGKLGHLSPAITDRLKQQFPGATINGHPIATHRDVFMVISAQQQGLSGEPPLILEDSGSFKGFPKQADYVNRKGVIQLNDRDTKINAERLNGDISAKITHEKEKAARDFVGQSQQYNPGTVSYLKNTLLKQILNRNPQKSITEVIDDFSGAELMTPTYTPYFRVAFLHHCLTELDFMALQIEENAKNPSHAIPDFAYLTHQQSMDLMSLHNMQSLKDIKANAYIGRINAGTMEVEPLATTGPSSFKLKSLNRLRQVVEYVSSPSNLALWVTRNSYSGQAENEYFTVQKNDDYYKDNKDDATPPYVDATLYRDFYTPKIVYRLNTRDWKLYQESKGIPGPDMLAQLPLLIAALNQQHPGHNIELAQSIV